MQADAESRAAWVYQSFAVRIVVGNLINASSEAESKTSLSYLASRCTRIRSAEL